MKNLKAFIGKSNIGKAAIVSKSDISSWLRK